MHLPQKLNPQAECVTSSISGAVFSSQFDIYLCFRNITKDIFSEATVISEVAAAPVSNPQKFK